MKKLVWLGVGLGMLGVVGVIAIQFVPYGRNHQNPPVVNEVKWNDGKTREIAKRACFDCHSNETVWPWYSNIAPVSWLIQHDVEEGRRELNFSNFWNLRKLNEAAEQVQKGAMPDPKYLITHPEARLTAEEKKMLIDGFGAMARQ